MEESAAKYSWAVVKGLGQSEAEDLAERIWQKYQDIVVRADVVSVSGGYGVVVPIGVWHGSLKAAKKKIRAEAANRPTEFLDVEIHNPVPGDGLIQPSGDAEPPAPAEPQNPWG